MTIDKYGQEFIDEYNHFLQSNKILNSIPNLNNPSVNTQNN